MKFRSFQDVSVAEVGLGTWQLGSEEWGTVAGEDALNILKTYTDNGGNFIDTADIYGGGTSERVIARFLKDVDKELFIATKLGRREDGDNGWPQNFTYEYIKRHTEDSLERLGVSQLFLQQLHCVPREQLEKGDVFDHLRTLQDEGLIRYWGASVETIEETLICLEQDGLASLQVIFNIFRQHLADEVFTKAKEKGVAIIARVPLASGLLTGRFDKDTEFPEQDHRNFNANGEAFNVGETFSGVEFGQGVELSRRIAGILPDERMAQWAIRWILDHPEVTTVIPGASKVYQVESNVQASELETLSESAHTQLRDLYDREIRGIIRGEV